MNNNSYLKIWKVGCYIRLSSEDRDGKEESNSVTNQRKLLDLFLKNNTDLSLIDYYVDDGYTGTDFNRPDFKRMIKDLLDGKINTIIVKDLSRFGRNYIEVGNYLEQIFPLYNVRFIAINDNIDSYKNPDSINNTIVPFKNLMNDEYARAISNSVKKTLKTNRLNGEYTGSIPPYGYIKDPKDKHHLIIDKEAAKVVQTIFFDTLKGSGKRAIARKLNNNGILSPTEYKRKVLKIKCGAGEKGRDKSFVFLWDERQIGNILKNQIYCGDLVQGKTRMLSHKVHKKIKVPKEQWIVIHNTHEAIIKHEVFEKVQDVMFSRDIRVCNNGKFHIFSGHLKCNDCGRSMTKKNACDKKYIEKHKKKRYIFYCSTYCRKTKSLCTKHAILYDTLEKIVLSTIKIQIDLVVNVEDVINEIKKKKNINYEKEICENSISKMKNEIDKYKYLKKEIYEDWKLEIITKQEYLDYSKDYDTKIKNLNEKLNIVMKKIKTTDSTIIEKDNWISLFRKNRNIEKLSKEVIDDLIDMIYICENNKVIIKFKYDDEYKQALEFIKNNEKCLNNIANNVRHNYRENINNKKYSITF